jgi:hypothetical protein
LCALLLRRAGIPSGRYLIHDTGDGILFSIDGKIAKPRLLTQFAPGLASRLVTLNDGRPAPEQMRLRMALHAGDVLADPQPLHGEAVILTSRLLDADVVRACLRVTDVPVALIVSSTIYEETVKHGYAGIDPDTYLPTLAEANTPAVVRDLHMS